MGIIKRVSVGNCLTWTIRGIVILYSAIYVILLICALFNVKLSLFSPFDMNFNPETGALEQFAEISISHPFGTDFMGFDIFSQIYAGIKTNFLFSLLAAAIFLIFGVLFGIRLGYYIRKSHDFEDFCEQRKYPQGETKNRFKPSFSRMAKKIIYSNSRTTLLEKVIYLVNSFPLILLVLVLILFLNQIVRSTDVRLAIEMAVFGLFSAPRLSAMIIGKIKALRAEEFIQSSISLGLSDKQIIWKHILWNECRLIILFQTMYMMGQATILEITLTYIEFGAQFPWISWGNILFNMQSAPLHIYILFPMVFVTLTIYMYMYYAEWFKEIDDKRNF